MEEMGIERIYEERRLKKKPFQVERKESQRNMNTIDLTVGLGGNLFWKIAENRFRFVVLGQFVGALKS